MRILRPRAVAVVAVAVIAAQLVLPARAGAIIGGSKSTSLTASSAVALVDQRFQQQYCGGTVVAASWILTAAHCAVSYTQNPGFIHVAAGGDGDLAGASMARLPVDQIIVHPQFDRPNRVNDLALLHLAVGTTVAPVSLMTSDVEPTYGGGATGLVVGWGAQTPTGGNNPTQRREATIPMLNDTECSGVIGTFVAGNQICAGTAAVGPCTGDSGGPLFTVDTKGTTRLAGVVSYGSNPCNVTPAGFSQVSVNTSWVLSVIGTPAPSPTPTPTPTPTPNPTGAGYWMIGADGKVYPFGAAQAFGDPTGKLVGAAVGIAPTPDDTGYWVVTTSGQVFAFGSAASLGSVPGGTLAGGELVTGMAATPSGNGYVVFTTRGRAVSFGDAPKAGDMTGTALNGPVLGGIITPSGKGYFMVASDGGIFTFGDAAFLGSMGGKRLNQPVRGLVPTASGNGYWLVASDGGIFTFGDAAFLGSMGSTPLNRPVVGMVRYGNGYLMVGSDGGIFTFSDLAFVGSLGANPPLVPITNVAVVS